MKVRHKEMVWRKEHLIRGWEENRLSGVKEEEECRMEVGAVKEVGQRRELGDRLTSGGNPTRPSELH